MIMWPFKKKEKLEILPPNGEDLVVVRNYRFITNTDVVLDVPREYVKKVIFYRNEKKLLLFVSDAVLGVDNITTSVTQTLREMHGNFNFRITYLDPIGCPFYTEIFTDAHIFSVTRDPIDYNDDYPSILCAEIYYESISYDYPNAKILEAKTIE